MQEDRRTLLVEYLEEHFHGSVLITDIDWNIIWYNWFFALKVHDYVQGQPLRNFLKPVEKTLDMNAHFSNARLELQFTSLAEKEIMHCTVFPKNGCYVLFEEAFPNEDANVVEIMCKLTYDMADQIRSLSSNNRMLVQSNKQIQNIMYTDDLTKIFNRRYINEKIDAFIRLAREHNSIFALLLIDIDHFKKINDQYGHLVGDLVLINVAQLIQNNIRYRDVVGRFGGEEFIVLIPEHEAKETVIIAEKLRDEIEHMNISGYHLNVTISVGITHYIYDNDTIDTIVKRADEAMYRAKSNGRNRIEI